MRDVRLALRCSCGARQIQTGIESDYEALDAARLFWANHGSHGAATRLALEPGDVILVKDDRANLGPKEAEKAVANLKLIFPGHEIVLLYGGATLEAVGASGSNALGGANR